MELNNPGHLLEWILTVLEFQSILWPKKARSTQDIKHQTTKNSKGEKYNYTMKRENNISDELIG